MTRSMDGEDDGGKWREMSMFRLVETVGDDSIILGSLESFTRGG